MTALSQTPLGLYWWRGVPNFGDALSALVVSHVSGRPVKHTKITECDLLAIGSLLQVMAKKTKGARADGSRASVWGAGLMRATKTDFLRHVSIALLRGPITAALLGIKARRFGDPGLLASDALGRPDQQSDRIAVVPHHTQLDDPLLAMLLEGEPALDLIDVRDNCASVCHRIASSRHVIASSLHGLIVADAYGVPNTWLCPGKQSHLKYHDYAAGIGRALIAPIEIHEVPELLASLKDSDRLPYLEGVERSRADLLATFPASLNAQSNRVSAARMAG